MYLVAGATGHLGLEICRRLAERGQPLRALVRASSDGGAVDRLRDLGAEIVVGDLRDPSSLDPASTGVTTVITTVNSITSRQEGDSLEATDLRGQRNLIEAAERAGVGHFVYVSFSGNIDGADALTAAKRGTEERLQRSSMIWTILRPGVFMEVWLTPMLGFDFPSAKATIYGSGEQKVSWISLADVAEFAVVAATDPSARNALIELGGPEALSPHEVVRVFEEESGRQFQLEHVPAEALKAKAKSAHDEYEKTFATLMACVAKGDPIPMDTTLRKFPIRMTSVRDYARRVSGSGGA
ncbi:MAG: SDR family oxidoreductase [Thermoanaerobaculia bacterium]